jgi:serine/threonine-protein kinase RsbW
MNGLDKSAHISSQHSPCQGQGRLVTQWISTTLEPIVPTATRQEKPMTSPHPIAGANETVVRLSEHTVWLRQSAHTGDELIPVIDEITSLMEREGYSSRDIFGLRLAVEEAGVNAIKHGHQDCPDKPVWLRYQVTREQVLVEIEDEGPGFEPERIPDPLAPENLERSCGRGLLLMRCYTTWLSYNERGNRVTLCKERSSE